MRTHDNHVEQARQKMGLVLSAWTRDLLKQPPANITLTPIAASPSEITKRAAAKLPSTKIDTHIANILANSGAGNPEAYGLIDKEPRMLLRGRIPIWLWVAAYIKLSEVWLGYPIA